MKCAPHSLPDQPPNDLTAGIDWARDDHAVAIVDARGKQVIRQTVEHSDAGLRGLLSLLTKHGVGEVVGQPAAQRVPLDEAEPHAELVERRWELPPLLIRIPPPTTAQQCRMCRAQQLHVAHVVPARIQSA